jgi:chloramphenicol-sensitive protein RarD
MSSSPDAESTDTTGRSRPGAREGRAGLFYAVAANICWGMVVLYWPLLNPTPAMEILAHRIVWSLVFVVVLLWVTHRLTAVRELIRRPRALAFLAGAAVFQGANWGTYIHAVTSGQVVQAALGYFITPVLTVLLAVVVLREKLRRLQWAAVVVGVLAVGILSVDYGRPPWLALVVGVCFAGYGFLRNRVAVGAFEGLAVETAILSGPALAWIVWLGVQGQATFSVGDTDKIALLAGGGVLTMVPLLFFGASVTRLPLATLGLLQYLAPLLQWLLGVLVAGEPMPIGRLLGFVVVWCALVLLALDGWRGAVRAAPRQPEGSIPA